MPQAIRPNDSTTRTPPAGRNLPAIVGQTTMHGCMDETTPVAADYVQCQAGSIGDALVVELGSPSPTPGNDFNHIIGVCASKDSADGAAVGLVCELRQSYVSESDLGTLIATVVCANVPATVDTYYRYRLTSTEAALITDYTALQLRFTTINGRGGAPRACRLHWGGVQLPDASDPSADAHFTPEELRRKGLGLAIVQESDRRSTGSTTRPF